MFEEPSHVWATPLAVLSAEQASEFEDAERGLYDVWPEVGSRMMTRVARGDDLHGGWIIVQGGTYRYAILEHGRIVRSVISEYLATEVCWD